MDLECPHCSARIQAEPGALAVCPGCGFSARVPAPRRGAPPKIAPKTAATRPPMTEPPFREPGPPFLPADEAPPGFAAPPADAAPRIPPSAPVAPQPPTRGRLVTALLINLLVPGLGTLHAERRLEGAFQLALFALGLGTIIFLVGLAIVPAAWTWALVSSIQALGGEPEGRPPVSIAGRRS